MNKDLILKAISHIQDENYELPLAELGLIRDIISAEHHVALTLLLHTDDPNKQEQYRTDIQAALHKADIPDVHIRLKVISKEEKDAIIAHHLKMSNKSSIHRNKTGTSPLLTAESNVNFIAIASGKGGVGKSTVTVNLAFALQRYGNRVGIIDADIYGFSIPEMMGIHDKPNFRQDRISPLECNGVQVISTGFFVSDNSPVVWRGPMLGKMLSTFLDEVAWGPLDYMLIDLPPGTGDIALQVHQKIPQCSELIVTTPSAAATYVAARAGKMALQAKQRIVGVIENMSYYVDPSGEKHYIFGQHGGALLAEQLQTKLLAQLPITSPDPDPANSHPLPSVYPPESTNGMLYGELAEHIIKTNS